jgi:hypothetical protein|uniref:hypothetical protein n=1 Tax=Prosthecobacter sp. TaxID=1965333 RepID=UPI003783E5BB
MKPNGWHPLSDALNLLLALVCITPALADGPTLPSKMYWKAMGPPAKAAPPAGAKVDLFLAPGDMPGGLQMLKGTIGWSKADEFGGTRLDFKVTNSAYQEIYGSAEMAVKPPKNFYNPAWRIRAPDDREVISNYIVLSESIQPRFEVLQGGYKMDRLMWVDSDKPDFQSSGQIVTFQDLGLPKDFPGWVGFKTDAQGHIRAVASACTADQFFKLELIATTAALQAKERQGRDGKYNLVDLTEITFDHFKQMAATAFNKLLGRGSKQDDGYTEIIAVLKKYRPLLFKDMTDAVIAEGLKAKEKSITGGPGPTLSLREMVKRIAKTQEFISQPVVGGAQPNPLINPETKIKETQDVAWEIAEAVQDLLPEAAGKLIGCVGFFKEAKEHMETVRDAILLPAGAEDVYARYKAGRGPAVDQDSTSAYDQAVSGRFAQMIRSAPEFKNMTDEKFTQVFRQRLEARYQMEQMELARAQMAADPEQLIQKIVGSYDSKINSVHSACEEIAASKR